MRYIFAILVTIASTIQAQAQAVLEPRHVQIIGVLVDDGWHFGENQKYECRKIEGDTTFVKMYVRGERLKGVMITNTRPNTPAEHAGLKCGDVIVKANDATVRSAKELQAVIYPLATDSEVSLMVRRATEGPSDKEARITVSLQEPVEMKIKTSTLDRVQELKAKLPVRTREFIDESYGPLVNILTTTTFAEKIPGHIEYTCTIAHRGEQAVLPIESPLLFMIGVSETLNLKKYEERVIKLDSYIERKGIPTLVSIPVHFAQRVGTDPGSMNAFFKANKGASVGVIDDLESSEKNWYHWRRSSIQCYVPEALAHEIRAKIRRLEYIGFRQ